MQMPASRFRGRAYDAIVVSEWVGMKTVTCPVGHGAVHGYEKHINVVGGGSYDGHNRTFALRSSV